MKSGLFFIFIVFNLISCSSKPSPEPLDPLANMLQHQVRYHGETLGLIAGWYTGKSLNWELIKSDNPGLDERRIKIGDVILIPKDMLKRSDPFTKDFVTKALPREVSPETSSLAENNTISEIIELEQQEENIIDLMEETQNSDTKGEVVLEPTSQDVIDATAGIFEQSKSPERIVSEKIEENPHITEDLKNKYAELEARQAIDAAEDQNIQLEEFN